MIDLINLRPPYLNIVSDRGRYKYADFNDTGMITINSNSIEKIQRNYCAFHSLIEIMLTIDRRGII